MNTYRHGALYVVESGREKAEIDAALKAVDDRLFVEKQITLANESVWCVVVDVGGDQPPMTVLEFRDDKGVPINELSWDIVERMKRMDRDGKHLAARVIRQNRDRIEGARKLAREQWEDIGGEFEKRMDPGYSAVLHRGQHLRRSRDKRRARGEKV